MKREFEKKILIEWCDEIRRAGLADLLSWLDTTDFYDAPASSVFHGNYTGGLVDHSMHVAQALHRINETLDRPYSDSTIMLVSLFHDICKVNSYVVSSRNVKNELTGQWEKRPYFKKAEAFAFGGHGSKSVFLLSKYVRLTNEEAAAINAHMGAWDKAPYGDPGDVYKQNKLAWMLHVADEYATYYMDKGEN